MVEKNLEDRRNLLLNLEMVGYWVAGMQPLRGDIVKAAARLIAEQQAEIQDLRLKKNSVVPVAHGPVLSGSMIVKAKTPAGRVLETNYTPFSEFVGLKLSLGMGMGFPDKLDPAQARMLAAGLIANADKAEAARAAAGAAR